MTSADDLHTYAYDPVADEDQEDAALTEETEELPRGRGGGCSRRSP